MKYNKDMIIGFLSGLAVPIVASAFWFFVVFERKGLTLEQYYGSFVNHGSARSKILALSLIAIVPLFWYFNNRERIHAMRGVILAVTIYALWMMYMMFF